MGFRISTNVAALNAQRNLLGSQQQINDSFSKLASGSRINKAADDAAGLAISEQLNAQIRSIQQTTRNANDGISMVQTAEGGLNEISNILIRLRELGIQAASDTIGHTERSFIDKEVQQQKNEIQRIAQVTKWGEDIQLLNGTGDQLDFQVGIYNDDFEDRISFNPANSDASLDVLGIQSIDFSTQEGAQAALNPLDEALTRVSSNRANLGALQNRLQSTVQNSLVAEENMAAANSRIRDTDVAAASAEVARNKILLQANVATLAQANQTGALALQLIG